VVLGVATADSLCSCCKPCLLSKASAA
jgi:hypothetical protein